MKAFQKHRGLAAVLDRADVDTDQIIPKQFLKKIERSGFGVHLFHDWRFLDAKAEQLNPDFELNQKRYAGASILVTGENFGCGSSREHALWALQDYGFLAIIAPSFADIFYSNCIKNGLLPIILSPTAVREIIAEVLDQEGAEITVDLVEQSVRTQSETVHHFEIGPFQKENLLHGKDEIDLSLEYEKTITAFEEKHFQRFPYYAIAV